MTDFQLDWHLDQSSWPEWGSAPRRPLVVFDHAHKGEWMDSVIYDNPATGKQDIAHVVRCELCILTHIFPLTPPDVLEAFYTEKFYKEIKKDYLINYEKDKEWWELCVHGPLLEKAFEYLAGSSYDPGSIFESQYDEPSILDIGAGPGIALDVAKKKGWLTWAVEPSEIVREHLEKNGHMILGNTLEDVSYNTESYFDIVYLYEVLEHQPNPEDFLLRCYDMLAPGGVIVVAVPNDYSPGQLEAAKKYHLPRWWLAPPDHQHYFTPKTLQLLLRRCGYTIRFTRMTFPLIEHFILEQGRCYVGDPLLGRQCHHERVAYELGMMQDGRWAELEEEYVDAVRTRRGREIIMIATKDGA